MISSSLISNRSIAIRSETLQKNITALSGADIRAIETRNGSLPAQGQISGCSHRPMSQFPGSASCNAAARVRLCAAAGISIASRTVAAMAVTTRGSLKNRLRRFVTCLAVIITATIDLSRAQDTTETKGFAGPARTMGDQIRLLEKGNFAALWREAEFDAAGAYLRARASVDPRCLPGDLYQAVRAFSSVLAKIDAGGQLPKVVWRGHHLAPPPDETIALLDAKDIARRRDEAIEALAASIDDPVARALRLRYAVKPTQIFTYPCVDSHPSGGGPRPGRELVSSVFGEEQMDKLLCYEGPKARLPSSNRTNFARAGAIGVALAGAGPEETEIIFGDVRRALAIWLSACTNCPNSTLLVIQEGETFWASSWFLDALDSGLNLAPLPENRSITVDERLTYAVTNLLPARIGSAARSGRVRPFEQLDLHSAGVQHLCAWPHETLAPAFKDAQDAVCRGRIKTFTIELRPGGDTPCSDENGQPESTIACALPDVGVQINTRHFEYTGSHGTGIIRQSDAASKTRLLLPVLTHEIGHWIGLDDDQRDLRNIMNHKYLPNKCVTAGNVYSLEDADFATTALNRPRALIDGDLSGPK